MKRIFTLLFLSASSCTLFAQQPFTQGHLVVYRVGDGTTALSSAAAPVFLDEYTTAGVLVQSVAMPSVVSGSNKRITASGSATSEGLLTRSVNGQYLVLGGYDADPATLAIAGTASTANNRVVARVDASANINSSTALTDFSTGNNIRSVASTDGNSIWVTGGATGIAYTTLGATTSTAVVASPTNIRATAFFNGQLYLSTASGSAVRLGAVGTPSPLPTTAGQTLTALAGLSTSTGSPYGFFFADLSSTVAGVDVLYIADDGTGTGIQKYSLVGGSWVSNGNITNGTVTNFTATRGLTGTVSGTTVTLYTVSNAGAIYSLVDNTGYNQTITANPTLLASAVTNTALRGIALAPTQFALPINLVSFNASLVNGAVQLWWSTASETNAAGFEVERSSDATQFTTAGKVTANGTASSYTYTDDQPLSGVSYYRLKLVDKDGTYTYSNTISINNVTTTGTHLSVYPNPVISTFTLTHGKAVSGAVIKVMTIDGKTIVSQPVATGATQSTVDASKLISGNYLVVFDNNGTRSTTQFVK